MAPTDTRQLTDEQRRAVETRGVSIALSAGAGCGKTHVLVERYISHLAPREDAVLEGSASRGADIEPAAPLAGLIAITFTDRAAREMRDRVRRTCRERLAAATDHAAPDWLALLRELETARVSTIHAFCGSLLRAHAVEAGLDPRFQILERGASLTLFSAQTDDELRAQLGRRNEDVLDLIVMFGLPAVRDMIQALLARRHEIDFDDWAKFTPEQLVQRWRDVEHDRALPMMRDTLLALPEVAELRLIISGSQPANAVMEARYVALTAAFDALPQATDVPGLFATIRENAKVVGGGRAEKWYSAEIYERFKIAAASLRNWIKGQSEKIGITPKSARASAAAGLALLRVARPVIAAYEARKRELGMLDFSDLLIGARDLLRGLHGAALQKQLSSRLVLLLVDEFQDTDPLQVDLVEILCGNQLESGNLFFVGDAKQSIYRFRGADPRVFKKLRDRIPAAGRMPLTMNFRSQPAVLDFVNALFCERLGPAYEALRANRRNLDDAPAIEFLWATPGPDNDQTVNAELLRTCEAEWIARRLTAIFNEQDVPVFDKRTKEIRPAQPGDVTILFRALSDVQYYQAALRRYGIPHYLVGGSAFYAQQEVFDLLNLLRALDSPRDEVSVAGALRSPFFSLADETLFWLAQHPAGLTAGLFAAQFPAELETSERRRAQFAAQTLRDLRARKDRLPIATLVREALALTGYDAMLTAEFLGERKLANLLKLVDQARAFDESGIFTLSDFIHELAEFVARQPDEPPAAVELESSTVVRLMSIHQAKGLEFPVVVVPDLTRSPGGTHSPAAFDHELGPLVRARRGTEEAKPCGLDLYRLLDAQEEEDEEIRLFYVATTRAADHLILSAGVKDLDRPTGRWLQLLAERFDLRSGASTVRLPAGYAAPRIAVTLEEPAVPAGATQAAQRVDLPGAVEAARDAAAAGQGVVSKLVAPIAPNAAARRVFSFSRLSGTFAALATNEDDSLPIERLAADPASDATTLGSLVHALLAQVDFDSPGDLTNQCRRELKRHFAAAVVEPATAVELVERFLRSPRASALRAATAVHRELEFLLAWPPGGATDGRMIQGFIDCLFQDASGQWHIVDYKTNRVTAGSVPQAAQAYQLQMYLYALAAEEALATSPRSLILHFLQPGAEHVLDWNAAARAATVGQVSEALTAQIH